MSIIKLYQSSIPGHFIHSITVKTDRGDYQIGLDLMVQNDIQIVINDAPRPLKSVEEKTTCWCQGKGVAHDDSHIPHFRDKTRQTPHTEDTKEMFKEFKCDPPSSDWGADPLYVLTPKQLDEALTLFASQVREKWLREEIVKLEGMKKETSMTYTHQCPSDCCVVGSDHAHEETVTIPSAVVYNEALQTIIDRYQAELTK